MGGDLREFSGASMFDYEVLLSAFRQKHGLSEPDITSADDLDDLYAALGEQMKANPEAWADG